MVYEGGGGVEKVKKKLSTWFMNDPKEVTIFLIKNRVGSKIRQKRFLSYGVYRRRATHI